MLLALPLGELSPQVTERANAVNSVAKASSATRNFTSTSKSSPFGGAGERSEPERVRRAGRGALFQKATNQPKLTAICFKKRHIVTEKLNKF